MTNIIPFKGRRPPPPPPSGEDELHALAKAYEQELIEMQRMRRRANFLSGFTVLLMTFSLIIRFIVMLICLLPLLFLLWLFTISGAKAGPVGQAMHNGSIMTMMQTPGGMVVRYAQPRPDLFGLVLPGTLLVEGKWIGPPPQMFVGTAFVFSSLCGPIPYPVRGTVDQSQALMLFGAAPQFDTACRILGYSMESQQSVLRFEPVR